MYLIRYLLYVIEHKINVGIECFLMGMPIHALTHDLSKFSPSEFFPYARFFYRKDRTNKYSTSDESDSDFQAGWCLHQKRNRHHWNYWVSVTRKNEVEPIPMPVKHVRQMVADWRGMSRKFGGTPQEYFFKNKDTMFLHPLTVSRVESVLKI